MALQQSCQINCPVGEDIWKDMAGRLEIRNNVSRHQAAQFNYPISLDAVRVVLAAHGKNVKAVFAPRRRRRRDSVQDEESYGTSSEES
jgi:hypothetical protein